MITKIKTITALSLLALSTMATAQTYPGLNFPQPEVNNPKPSVDGTDRSAPSLNDLLSNRIKERGSAAQKSDVSEMRRQAIVDIASALGASGGLASRMAEIRNEVNQNAYRLDSLYDFTKVIVGNGVLPPVLTEGLSNYSQESDDEVRISDKKYKIEAKAKFVSVYPTWRSYLVFSYPSYEIPPAAYLPKNSDEKAIWDQAVKDGWTKGVMQANNIFELSFNRLNRDYLGMIKYKILLKEGLITPAIIAKQNMGVTGGGDEMDINDSVLRITDHSALNPNKSQWNVEYPVTNNVNGTLK